MSRRAARCTGRWALAVALLLAASTAARGEGAAQPASPEMPIVVELFTSQGCISCPPADKLLSELDRVGGVIPLEYHVDSWNHDGWSDPFSSAEWTRRQAFYVRTLGAPTAYTPQAVVGGAREVLGSDSRAVAAAIVAAEARPRARLTLAIESFDEGAGRLTVTARTELPQELAGRKLDLLLALTEFGLETEVKRGENGGRTLHNDGVVRSLERLGRATKESGSEVAATATLRIDRRWSPGGLRVVGFLQDPRTLEIVGAASRPLAESKR